MWGTSRKPRRAGSWSAGSGDDELLAAIVGEHVDALQLLHQRHAPWMRAPLARCG